MKIPGVDGIDGKIKIGKGYSTVHEKVLNSFFNSDIKSNLKINRGILVGL